MKTLLIDIQPHFEFQNILNDLKLTNIRSIRTKYISFKKSLGDVKLKKFSNKIHYTYEEILKFNSTCNIPEDLDRNKIYNYLDKMLSDPKLISIFERSFFTTLNNTKRIRLISILFFQAINFLKKIKPHAYILFATPHNINIHIFKWACFSLDIDVIYPQESLLPWRYYIFTEKDNDKYLFNLGDRWNEDDRLQINQFKKKVRDVNYLAPYVLQNKKKFFTILGDLKKYWKRPDLIFNKVFIFNFYNKITKKFKLPKSNYIFFPLHFSPERSTLPDGGKYFDQFRALHEIRSKFGKNIKIIVKEHPTTFVDVCHWGERTKHFYNSILNLNNIIFAPINYPTTKLIKNSMCTIVINSNVAFEGLLLDKNVIYMSDFRFFGPESKNLYKFKNLNKKKLLSIYSNLKKKNTFSKNWFEKYTITSKKNTIDFFNSLNSMRSDRSKCYNIMIQKLVSVYANNEIKKYLKKSNEV
jgi:hypothetical protein